jgi:UDP-N-acetylglucosamine--N-acetylmuramyl-(pentapeptide) pyrophosphoryl-undecaprenol N-acetylglucosamine transferase
MKLVITGGGTGGHLVIAKALAETFHALEKNNNKNYHDKAIFIGSTSGQDQSWFKDSNIFKEKYFFNTTGVVNQKGFNKIIALLKVILAFFKSLTLVYKADAVISVGGFSAAPASLAAIILRKPFFIHEQNAVMGKLNRLLKPYAKAFFSSYHDGFLVDYPINKEHFEKARVRTTIKHIIFLGGSQGATAINELALKIVPILQQKNIQITHQCGKHDFERISKFYHDNNIKANCFAFSTQLTSLISQADFAVSRAGASTLWELCAQNVPALYIPYPYAASDHQFHNAKFLLHNSASWLAREDEDLTSILENLLDENLKEKSEMLKTLITPDGALKILNIIKKEVN